MTLQKVTFSRHAAIRMLERDIGRKDVHRILADGEVIESYPEDHPHPSRLILGSVGQRPVHVVAASNESEHETIVITVYEPDADKWSADWRRRYVP